MDYFPAFLNLDGKPCLLVGGGEVAARKARLLVGAGAVLAVVAPEIVPALHKMLAGPGSLRWFSRRFEETDLDGQWLVVSATGDPLVGKRVAAAAEQRRVFCNSVDDAENCSYITPAIVDRSPVLVAISSGGSAPVLVRRIREKIEALLPGRLGDVAQYARELRSRVTMTVSDFSARLRFWERFFDGNVESAILSGNRRAADTVVERLLDDSVGADVGEAWLVGAGPGDAGLLTIAALQAMQRADVILHDRLVSGEVLALARRDAMLVSVGKTPGCTLNSQEEINEQLVTLVRAGKRVCRLKGGDPFIFGRGGEEADALDEHGLPWHAIPGITAAAGCAAVAGIPLTHRDDARSVVLLTAHGKSSVDDLDWSSLARDRQTLAVYMAVNRFPDLMQKLISHGRAADTPVAIVERGTTPAQRVVRGTLGQLTLLARAHRVEAPAMLVIGDVARRGHTGACGSGTMECPADATFLRESAIHTG
ncbi:MAG: siroheme synthase CysG [Woeseiaceae bacterium]